MNFSIHTFSSEAKFLDSALNSVLASIKEAVAQHGHGRIGLAGGSTPKKLYERLSQENLPWEKLTWILIDERKVPKDDFESNFAMISQALFEPAHVPSECEVFFDTKKNARKAVAAMEEELKSLEKIRQPLFDLLILGAGKDGHIASLFEGDPLLFTDAYAYETTAPDTYPTRERMTLSLKALTSAKKALLLLNGPEKRPVVGALEGKEELPLTALRQLNEKTPLEVLAHLDEQQER